MLYSLVIHCVINTLCHDTKFPNPNLVPCYTAIFGHTIFVFFFQILTARVTKHIISERHSEPDSSIIIYHPSELFLRTSKDKLTEN